MIFEYAIEIIDVLKATGGGNLGECKHSRGQHLLCSFHADTVEVTNGADAFAFLKEGAEIGGGNAHHSGNMIGAQITVEILLHILLGIFHGILFGGKNIGVIVADDIAKDLLNQGTQEGLVTNAEGA